jgi:hypothetical protein
MAGTDINEIYDRLQERIELEDMNDEVIEAALLENFTNRRTSSGNIVDLTSNHSREEWKDASHKIKRIKEVKGFTPRLKNVVSGIKSRRDKEVDLEIKKIIKPFYRKIAAVERGDYDKLYEELNEREEQLEKWRGVKENVDDLIRDNVNVYREEIKLLEEYQIEQEQLEQLEEIEEERKARAAKKYKESKRRKV